MVGSILGSLFLSLSFSLLNHLLWGKPAAMLWGSLCKILKPASNCMNLLENGLLTLLPARCMILEAVPPSAEPRLTVAFVDMLTATSGISGETWIWNHQASHCQILDLQKLWGNRVRCFKLLHLGVICSVALPHLCIWENWGSVAESHLPIFTTDKSVLEMNSNILTSCLVFFPLHQTSSHSHFPLMDEKNFIWQNSACQWAQVFMFWAVWT